MSGRCLRVALITRPCGFSPLLALAPCFAISSRGARANVCASRGQHKADQYLQNSGSYNRRSMPNFCS